MDAARNSLPPLAVKARRFCRGRWEDMDEVSAREESVRVIHGSDARELWAWPHDLEDLALGHVLLDCASAPGRDDADAALEKAAEVRTARALLRPGLVERLAAPEGRHCLRVSLGEVDATRFAESHTAPRLSAAALLARMAEFFAEPGLWDGTGSFHRAGLFCPAENRLVRVAEDIGRHNCLDRLAGFCARQGLNPAAHVLFLSARITGSLYSKARRAGFELLAGRGAVTSAALALAKAQNVTLVGFCRPAEERLTIFCDAEGRVTG